MKHKSPKWIGELSFVPWFKPYTRKPGQGGKQNGAFAPQLIAAKGKRGVYLIADGKKVLYVGSTRRSLYQIITRKFQTHNDRNFDRWTVDPDKVENLIVTFVDMTGNTGVQVANMETALIEKYNPPGNIAGTINNQNNFLYSKAVAARAAADIKEHSDKYPEPDPTKLPEDDPDFVPF